VPDRVKQHLDLHDRQPSLGDIALYLNSDMMASPNFGRFIYDGDNCDGIGAGPGPTELAAIDKLSSATSRRANLPLASISLDMIKSSHPAACALGLSLVVDQLDGVEPTPLRNRLRYLAGPTGAFDGLSDW